MKTGILVRPFTDTLKVLSAFLVVMGHYASSTLIQGWSQSRIWWAIASNCGYIGVAIFFFLSGYGLMESEKQHPLCGAEFFRKRFLKIYKPVLFVTLLWLLFELSFLNKTASGLLLYELFWGFDDCVLWFVKILFGLYVAFYGYAFLRSRQQALSGLVLLAVCTIGLMYVAYVTEGYSSLGIPCFLLGVVLSAEGKTKPVLWMICLFLFAGLIFTWVTKDNHGVHASINYGVIALLLVFSNRLGQASDRWLSSRVIAEGASVSFDLYLVHMKVMTSLVFFNLFWGGYNAPITILICLILSLFMNKLRRMLRI